MPIFNNSIIFLHIPRTGGSIIENFLQNKYQMNYFGADNFGLSMQHYTLDNILKLNPDLNKSYKFTFIRNPFDRILSSYLNWTINNTPNFDDYIDMVKNVVDNKLYLHTAFINTNDISHYIPQSIMINNNDIDFIGRFENYDTDVKELCKQLNIDCNITITKRNANYKHYYSERNKKIIEEIYDDDLKLYNYSF